jgi:transposase
MLDLLVEHQAGIPLSMRPLRGNTNDTRDVGEVVTRHMAPLCTTAGLTSLVADSALYSEANLSKLAATGTTWITRVPGTLVDAQAALEAANPQTMASLTRAIDMPI